MKDVALDKAKRLLDRYDVPVDEKARLASIMCVALGMNSYFPVPQNKYELQSGQTLSPFIRHPGGFSSDENIHSLKLLSTEFPQRTGCRKMVRPEFGQIDTLDLHPDLSIVLPECTKGWLVTDMFANNFRSAEECQGMTMEDRFMSHFDFLFAIQINGEYFKQLALLESSHRPDFNASGYFITDKNGNEKTFCYHFVDNEPRLSIVTREITYPNLFSPHSQLVEIIE